jgi:hypothetical protein
MFPWQRVCTRHGIIIGSCDPIRGYRASTNREGVQYKAFRTFIYSLFRSGRVRAKIKLTFRIALIRSIMTYACPAWEFATDTYLLKLQRLQNKVLRITGNFPRCTLVCYLHTAFNLRICTIIQQRQQTEVIQSWEWTCLQCRTRRSQTQKIKQD